MIDDYRSIKNTHTQVRLLTICSIIIKLLNDNGTVKSILKNRLIDWSKEEERISVIYRNSRGKITNTNFDISDKSVVNVRITTAFNHYIEYARSLKLITTFNEYVVNTFTGSILNNLIDKKYLPNYRLDPEEKIFYLVKLLYSDADIILLILDLLNDVKEPINQRYLLENGKSFLLDRLRNKIDYSRPNIKNKLNDIYHDIKYNWKGKNEATKYLEHIIPPRLEWLHTLELIDINKNGSSYYTVRTNGKKLLDSAVNIPNSNMHDINEQWLMERMLSVVADFYLDGLIKWSDIDGYDKVNIVGELLIKSFLLYCKDGSYRLSYYPAVLYIQLEAIINYNIIIEEIYIDEILSKEFEYNGKKFILKKTTRKSESYVSMRIMKDIP